VSVWNAVPLVVGHRGGRGEGWPKENTLAAFERAREQGASAIELDVRTCLGGEVVVFHDVALDRMTGGRDARRVSDASAEELQAIDVPRLEEVLAWARTHRVGVNVEMKHDVPSRAKLARAAVRLVLASGADVLLSSFDPLLLAMTSALAPSVPRALLVHAGQPRWADALQGIARPPLVPALHMERGQADPRTLATYARRRLRVGVWTVNDPKQAVDLVRLGVGTIITDKPGEILAALGSVTRR